MGLQAQDEDEVMHQYVSFRHRFGTISRAFSRRHPAPHPTRRAARPHAALIVPWTHYMSTHAHWMRILRVTIVHLSRYENQAAIELHTIDAHQVRDPPPHPPTRARARPASGFRSSHFVACGLSCLSSLCHVSKFENAALPLPVRHCVRADAPCVPPPFPARRRPVSHPAQRPGCTGRSTDRPQRPA